MENNYRYKYYTVEAKRDYHKRMEEIITMNLDNENDRVVRKRLCARRRHHRRMYRKYEALASHILNSYVIF